MRGWDGMGGRRGQERKITETAGKEILEERDEKKRGNGTEG